MEELFEVNSYRSYLDNYFVYKNDKNNCPYGKKRIDRCCDEILQKIIEDTKAYISYIIDISNNKDYIIGPNLIINLKLREKCYFFKSNIFNGWSSDELYCPDGFDYDFFVSRHLLERFFNVFGISVVDGLEHYCCPLLDREAFCPSSEIFIKGSIKMFGQIDQGILFDKKEESLVKTKVISNSFNY